MSASTSAPGAVRREELRLADGRILAWHEFGRSDGTAAFYFHGSPSSGLEPSLVGNEAIAQLGLRLIAPDRPGVGGSTFQVGRRMTDWPADVAALADNLRLNQFHLMGNSGGGPYVAVCAARIPERIRSASILSSGWRMDWPEARGDLPFVNRIVFILAKYAPWLLGKLLGLMGDVSHDREKELAQLKQRMAPADFAVFSEPGRLEAFGETMKSAMAQGSRGATYDLCLYVRDFGFSPGEVRVPIRFFHGESDMNSPIALVRRVVASMPGATLKSYPGEAHLSTLCRHFFEAAPSPNARTNTEGT